MSSPPDWLTRAVTEQLGTRPATAPGWLSLDTLPAIEVELHALTPRDLHAVLNALRQSTLARPAPLVALLREKASPGQLDAFSECLFSRWIEQGCPSRERWMFQALVPWAGPLGLRSLTGQIRSWMEHRQFRRAREGVELLRAIGSDEALLELSALSQVCKNSKLKQDIGLCLLDLALARGLGPEQLEDRAIPTLGLESGGHVFDLGGRSFHLVLGADLMPRLRDATGKLRADLPAVNSTDDPDLALVARAEWKIIKKKIRDILKTRSVQLEQAMLSGRRWPRDDFLRYLVAHPIVGYLTRRLLWQAWAGPVDRFELFRVTEDRQFARADESLVPQDQVTHVTLVHPVHLAPETLVLWQAVFADHQLIAPLAQLDRIVHRLRPEERDLVALARQEGVLLPAISLMGTLDRLGWQRGVPRHEGGVWTGLVTQHVKEFPWAGIQAVLCHTPGVAPFGFQVATEEQRLGMVYFARNQDFPDPIRALPLHTVDAVVLSEVLGVLEKLAGQGKRA